MIILGMAAARRSMREHQGIPPRQPQQPLWRLLLGEAGWALRELAGEPRVLGVLLIGAVVTPALLGAAAPGPVLPWPGRIVVGLVVGLALARGAWTWVRRDRDPDSARPDAAPAIAATEVVAGLVALVLAGWLVAWLVTLLV